MLSTTIRPYSSESPNKTKNNVCQVREKKYFRRGLKKSLTNHQEVTIFDFRAYEYSNMEYLAIKLFLCYNITPTSKINASTI